MENGVNWGEEKQGIGAKTLAPNYYFAFAVSSPRMKVTNGFSLC